MRYVCMCVCGAYFRLHDAVHDGLQGLQPVALHDALKVLRAVLQRLGHRDVQVVVRLLRRQVLCTHTHQQGA